MAYSLASFHFNPIKFGQICKQYAKDRGISQASMAANTGLSYDTVVNIYQGKVQKIPFEYVFKMCVVLAIPIEVVMMIMLKDEEIDFLDQVMLYNTVEDVVVPVEEAVPTLVPAETPEAVVETAAQVTAAMPVVEASVARSDAGHNAGSYTAEELHTIIGKINDAHNAHLDDLRTAHAREQEAAEKHCEQLFKLAMTIAQGGLA